MPIRLHHLEIVPLTPQARLRQHLALLVRVQRFTIFGPVLARTCTLRVEQSAGYDMQDDSKLQVLLMRCESSYGGEMWHVI